MITLMILMPGTSRRTSILMAILFGLLFIGQPRNTCAAEAVEPIKVELKNGHLITGRVDSKTTEKRLWIRHGESGIEISTSIDWAEIARVQHNGQSLNADAFRPLVEQLKTDSAEDFFMQRRTGLPPVPNQALPQGKRSNHSQIQSLEIEAYVANWDRDVATDGIELRVFPLNSQNRVTPISGSLNIKLFGRDLEETGIKDRFPQLNRWNQKIDARDFKNGKAIYRLPFRNVHPDFDHNLGNNALVHVRLGVPGQGVFEASDALVRLRLPSRFRDQLQQERGTRYLAPERVYR